MFFNFCSFSYNDFITGEKFQDLCEFNFRIGAEVPNRDLLIFARTEFLPHLFKEITKKHGTYKIISHNTDANIVDKSTERRDSPESNFFDFEWKTIPTNISSIYAVNVDIKDPRLFPIPIGLENECWFKDISKKQKMLSYMKDPPKKDAWAYLNVNCSTNASIRSPLYPMFQSKTWTDSFNGRNGHNFDSFLRMLSNHHFIISPDGHGFDTHRTWEALYMNSIPIVLDHVFTRTFSEMLPILVIKNYNTVTLEFLQSSMEEMQNKTFNQDSLKFSYWKRLIVG
jgi:hypothetical protein